MVHDSNYFWGFPQVNEDEFDKEKKIIAGNLSLESKTNVDVKKFSDMIALKSIDVKIKRGEFVAIIGEVGSGKSSLISSLIGDMIYLDSEIIRNNHDQEISSNTKELIDSLNHAIRAANTKASKNPPVQIAGTMSLVEQIPWI